MFNIIAIFLQKRKKRKRKKETEQRRKFNTTENKKHYQTVNRVDLTNNVLISKRYDHLEKCILFLLRREIFCSMVQAKINEHFCLGVHDYKLITRLVCFRSN